MSKTIPVQTINKRLVKLREEFGVDSAVYKAAEDYIKEHFPDKIMVEKKNKNGEIVTKKNSNTPVLVEKKMLNKDKDGHILSISKNSVNLGKKYIFGRSEVFDEYIPTVSEAYKREADLLKERIGPPTTLEQKIISSKSQKEMVADPKIKAYLKNQANRTAKALNEYEDIVDTLYEAASKGTEKIKTSAQNLLDIRERTVDWIAQAKLVVEAYEQMGDQTALKNLEIGGDKEYDYI